LHAAAPPLATLRQTVDMPTSSKNIGHGQIALGLHGAYSLKKNQKHHFKDLTNLIKYLDIDNVIL
jgi:hypothetical protein